MEFIIMKLACFFLFYFLVSPFIFVPHSFPSSYRLEKKEFLTKKPKLSDKINSLALPSSSTMEAGFFLAGCIPASQAESLSENFGNMLAELLISHRSHNLLLNLDSVLWVFHDIVAILLDQWLHHNSTTSFTTLLSKRWYKF